MKIKNQFLVSITAFVIITAVIAGSILVSQQQTAQLSNQQELARSAQTHASNLAYLSSDYFLYQDNSSIAQWQAEFSSLSSDVSKISTSNPEQQALLRNVGGDAQQLNTSWNIVVSYLAIASRNVSIRVLPEFQADWSVMSAQNQALVFDAQQLSQSFRDQTDQLTLTSAILILVLLGLFGAYFIINYLITYRNTLKSISELQKGIEVIGSGNLDQRLKADKKDEIGEISRSFNKMVANLKTVTASKTDLERAQAALRESEQRWATTLSSIGDAVIATDTLSNITFMNAEAENLTGWTLREVSQEPVKTAFNIINEQTRHEVESPIDRVLKEGMIVGLANHTVLIRKDGTELPIDDSGAPIRDREGKTTGVVLIFRDITERKKAEEATARQAELIDLSPDAIIVRKLDGTITFWSKGAEKLYGWTKEEAVGQVTHRLFSAQFPLPLEEILAKIKADRKWSGEIVHTCKNGDKLVVQSFWLAKFDADGEILEMLESNVDVTERVELQTKLEESAIRLEEYANQMEALANQRAAQLKDAERLAAIGATAGMVGHDIRNPLQAIASDVYLARSDLSVMPEGKEKEELTESLDGIAKNVDYINKIVQDLQDYARPLNPVAKETNLRAVIDDIVCKNGVPDRVKVHVKVQKESSVIIADPDIVKRVLTNLVTNAVQAMPEGGELDINAFQDSYNTVITVEDTGVGIPEEVKPRLFTPLFTTKARGQGFGLVVVKRMIEALGGTVTFESEIGKGTKFIICLPPKRDKR